MLHKCIAFVNPEWKNPVTLIRAVELLRENGFAIAGIDIYEELKKVIDLTGLMGRWQIVGLVPKRIT